MEVASLILLVGLLAPAFEEPLASLRRAANSRCFEGGDASD